jgi:hypothetical protein
MKQIAVAWLNEADWSEWLAIDKQLLPYHDWKRKIEAGIRQIQSADVVITKIEVGPAAFVAWCMSRGLPIDRVSRATYAATMLAERSESVCQ